MRQQSPSIEKDTPSSRGNEPSRRTISQAEFAQLFSKTSFEQITYRLKRGDYVSGDELAAAISANPRTVLPSALRNYLCQFLSGKIEKPRGRKKKKFSFKTEALMITVALAYDDRLAHFQAQRKAEGRRSRGALAPHEKAAAAVQNMFPQLCSITPRRLANILSSRKKPPQLA